MILNSLELSFDLILLLPYFLAKIKVGEVN